jgi:lysophospholipase L1-like esterase
VALGDSYTIGTSVKAEDRWPNQLVRTLRSEIDLRLVANLGVNGYTTADLMAEELPELEGLDPEFVSLQIGVNDVVRRVSPEQYRENVAAILDDLRTRVGAERILVVSTPDYTLTPEGPRFGDAERQSSRIERFNEILREEADERGMRYVDITPVADRVRQDASLVAGDGLHPSGKQYAGWVELIAPHVREMLSGS